MRTFFFVIRHVDPLLLLVLGNVNVCLPAELFIIIMTHFFVLFSLLLCEKDETIFSSCALGVSKKMKRLLPWTRHRLQKKYKR